MIPKEPEGQHVKRISEKQKGYRGLFVQNNAHVLIFNKNCVGSWRARFWSYKDNTMTADGENSVQFGVSTIILARAVIVNICDSMNMQEA